MRHITLCCLILLLVAPGSADRAQEERDVRAFLDKYIGLYARDTLDEWRTLFLPSFIAGFTNDDGSVSTRTLDDFFERQKKYFATGRPIREELANTRIERAGRLVSVRSDFILFDGNDRRPGRLMMLLIRDRDRLKIHSLTFTYHGD